MSDDRIIVAARLGAVVSSPSPADPTREEARSRCIILSCVDGYVPSYPEGEPIPCPECHPGAYTPRTDGRDVYENRSESNTPASPGEAGEDELTERANRFMAALMDRRAYTDASIVSDLLVSVRALGSMARDWKAEADRRQYRLSSQSQEIARLRRRVEIMDRALTRYVPCADHRDKLVAGECQVCRRERAESQLARLREALGLAAALIADFTQHSDPRFARLSGQLAEVLNG